MLQKQNFTENFWVSRHLGIKYKWYELFNTAVQNLKKIVIISIKLLLNFCFL